MLDLGSRTLGFTRDGKRCVCVARDRLIVRDLRGGSAEVAVPGVTQLGVFGDQVWTIARGTLERWELDGRMLGPAVALGDEAGALLPSHAGPAMGVWACATPRVWLDDLGTWCELDARGDQLPFAGRRTITVERRRGEPVARLGQVSWALPVGAKLVATAALFDGAGVLLVVRREGVVEAWVSSSGGQLRHRLELPAGDLRLAARCGLVLVRAAAGPCEVVDLRFGRRTGTAWTTADDVAIDPDGMVLALRRGDDVELITLRAAQQPRASVPAPSAPLPATAVPADPAPPRAAVLDEAPGVPTAREPVVAAPPLSRAFAETVFGVRPAAWQQTREAATHALDREIRLVGLRALVAIAEGWDDRRIGYANESAHPHEHEVSALLGMGGAFAPDHVSAARRELADHQAELDADPDRRGPTTAIGALALELGLSPLAVDILLVAAAPTVWGEAARLFGIASNDPGRAVVDELLIQQILGATGASRHDLALALDPRAPLRRSGALQAIGSRPRPFTQLEVDPVVIARLRAEPPDLGAAVAVRDRAPVLEALDVPRDRLAATLASLAAAPEPVRLEVRGRAGAGRRTLVAALAREAGRSLAVIDAMLLPRSPEPFAAALRAALRRAHLAGSVPCVAGLDQVSFGERPVADVVREVLRAHPGPLAVVGSLEAPALFDPGHVALELPVLDETQRCAIWERVLGARGLWVRDLPGLAARYRVGPGVIRRAVDAAAATGDRDASDAIEAFVRQTRDARLASVAQRVERTASWASLVLPSDVLDSLRELVGRVRHRRQVFEEWGMGATMSTSRGITALFQGQPGTGKTLVAGVIARELGLDLYRVDLSKVMSKWIGETERNLATLFDAAEDGQVILLFDEADSLFSKRTEVRSSNDRYANLEVNYLLQRLDTFEGIAILTTNFGGSIDQAFKRRMSFRLSFPFPDEDTREQLWRAHLPPRLPIEGELALDRLARKYQLAGGYIRNACLRAAFLAAQEERALIQDHLERAVALELTEAGKLSSSGAID